MTTHYFLNKTSDKSFFKKYQQMPYIYEPREYLKCYKYHIYIYIYIYIYINTSDLKVLPPTRRFTEVPMSISVLYIDLLASQEKTDERTRARLELWT
jgi:hypothetical protein